MTGRKSRRPARNYCTVPNAIVRNTGLSAEARLLLVLMMSYADHWTFRRDHLIEMCGVGPQKFDRMMRELRQAGYVRDEFERDAQGKIVAKSMVLMDDPSISMESHVNENPNHGQTPPIRIPTEKNTKREEDPPTSPQGGKQPLLLSMDEQPRKQDDGSEEAFETFWGIYPAKGRVAKKQAKQKFLRAIRETPAEKIIKGARAYARSQRVADGFVAHAVTWLNQERWTAEVDEPERSGHRYIPPSGEVSR